MKSESTNNDKLDVFLVEDSPLITEIILENLNSINGIQVVSYADTQSQALINIEKHKPDLVIVDLELLEGNGLYVLTEIKHNPEKFGHPKKIVFTNHTSPLLKRKCESMDIHGFYDKSYQIDDMLDFIEDLTSTK